MGLEQDLLWEMAKHDAGNAKRIQHFTKVYAYAAWIGEREELAGKELQALVYAAIVHDIGIRPAEEKYGSCSGKLQEQEGPPLAEKMLGKLGIDGDIVERVSYLVGHHHTYGEIDGADYQILVEADFLVNLYEDGAGKETVKEAYGRIFRTEAGKELCRTMFGLEG